MNFELDKSKGIAFRGPQRNDDGLYVETGPCWAVVEQCFAHDGGRVYAVDRPCVVVCTSRRKIDSGPVPTKTGYWNVSRKDFTYRDITAQIGSGEIQPVSWRRFVVRLSKDDVSAMWEHYLSSAQDGGHKEFVVAALLRMKDEN